MLNMVVYKEEEIWNARLDTDTVRFTGTVCYDTDIHVHG